MSTSSTTVSGSIEITPDSPLENAIVDTSQTFDIIHRGGVMRNVGFDGQATVDSSFGVQIPSGTTGEISHVYLGDGDGRTASIGAASAGIFVSAKHAGHLQANEVYGAGWSDNFFTQALQATDLTGAARSPAEAAPSKSRTPTAATVATRSSG